MQTASGTNIVSPPISHTSRELGPVAAAVAVHCNVHPAVTRNSVVSRRPIAGGGRAGVDVNPPSSPVSPLTDSVFSDKRESPNRVSVYLAQEQANADINCCASSQAREHSAVPRKAPLAGRS